MEATASPDRAVEERFDAVEAAIAAGTPIGRSGFWPLVATIKADPALVEAYADRAGRIDAAAFRANVRPIVPVAVGNLAMLGVLLGGVVALVLAAATDGWFSGLCLLAAAGTWALGVHAPTHWLVGRAMGMRFIGYFVGGPPPPRPGLKTDYATYLRVPARRRAWFHASGAIATKIAPFLVLAIAPLVDAPGWAVLAVAVVAIFQIVTDVVFSTKTSDWKKFSREMAFARDAG